MLIFLSSFRCRGEPCTRAEVAAATVESALSSSPIARRLTTTSICVSFCFCLCLCLRRSNSDFLLFSHLLCPGHHPWCSSSVSSLPLSSLPLVFFSLSSFVSSQHL